MEILFYKEKKFKQYLDLPIYSSECGIILRKLNNNEFRVFKQTLISNGYLRITTSVDGKQKAISSHRLIAICWIENSENKPQVNHINGIKIDNCIYYSHTDRFSFGWRSPVSAEVVSEILNVISEFPFLYEIKCDDGKTLQN